MTTVNTGPVQGPFYSGEKEWLRWNVAEKLDGSRQIASVTFVCESPVTEVVSTKTIYTYTKTNDSVKAQFDFTSVADANNRFSVTAYMTCNDGSLIVERIIATVQALPT